MMDGSPGKVRAADPPDAKIGRADGQMMGQGSPGDGMGKGGGVVWGGWSGSNPFAETP